MDQPAGPKTAARVSVGKSASVFLLGRAPPARTTRRAGESRSHGDGRHACFEVSRRHGGRHAAHGQGTQPRRGGSDGGGGARDARLGVPAVPPMHPSVRGARGAARSGARRRAPHACLHKTPRKVVASSRVYRASLASRPVPRVAGTSSPPRVDRRFPPSPLRAQAFQHERKAAETPQGGGRRSKKQPKGDLFFELASSAPRYPRLSASPTLFPSGDVSPGIALRALEPPRLPPPH